MSPRLINQNLSPYNPSFLEKMLNLNIGIPAGVYDGADNIHKFGASKNISIQTYYQDIWDGAAIYTCPTSLAESEDLDIISTTLTDNQTLLVEGLDINGVRLSEQITLTGTLAKQSLNKWYRVFRIYNISSTPFEGTLIFFKRGTSQSVISNVRAKLLPKNQSTQSAQWTVPKGYVGLGSKWSVSISRGGQDRTVTTALRVRRYGHTYHTWSQASLATLGGSTFTEEYKPFILMPELMDISIAVVDASANDIIYSASLAATFIPMAAIPNLNLE